MTQYLFHLHTANRIKCKIATIQKCVLVNLILFSDTIHIFFIEVSSLPRITEGNACNKLGVK